MTLAWATTTCEHGISCNEACDRCEYDEYLESLAAQEDAESDAMRRWQR